VHSLTSYCTALSLHHDPELEVIEATLSQILEDEKIANRQKLAAEGIIAGEDIITPNLGYSVLNIPTRGTADVLKIVRAHITEYEEHVKALTNGDSFTPEPSASGGAAKASKKPLNGKKRKRIGGGKKGSPKRQRIDADGLDDFIVNDSETDANDKIYKGGDDHFDANREFNAGSGGQDQGGAMGSRGEAMVKSITAKLVETREAMELSIQREKAASEDCKNAINALTSLREAKLKAQRQKNCFCSLKRSEVRINVSAAGAAVVTPFPVLD